MYKSPSIEIFENASHSIPVPVAGTGFATVGFSTNGPVNKLMRFTSLSDFEKYMGRPIENYEFTHNMINRTMNTGFGGSLYFMRVGKFESDDDGKASVTVSNYSGGEGWEVDIYSKLPGESGAFISKPWFIVDVDNEVTPQPTSLNVAFSFTLNDDVDIIKNFIFNSIELNIPLYGEATGGPYKYFACPIDKIVKELNNDKKFSSLATASLYIGDNDSEYGLTLKGKQVGADSIIEDIAFDISTVGYDGEGANSVIYVIGGDYEPELGLTGTVPTIGDYYFSIITKNPGSSGTGMRVKKESKTNPVTNVETFTVSVYATSSASSLLETFEDLTLDNFVEKINDATYGSDFIYIDTSSSPDEDVAFKDGTYVLGEGEVLVDGSIYNGFIGNEAVEGTDGLPMDEWGNPSEDEITDLFVDALRDPSFRNLDNVEFTVVATPDSQAPEVQDAAIELAISRGDCIYVADVPLDYMGSKAKVDQAINWHNGVEGRATPISTSYAVIYYGWLPARNAYGSNNVILPPSVFMVPKFLQLDAELGPSYSPAGANRGRIFASDYLYSPDLEDREKLCGDTNCINPIIFSNTRGLMAFSQKTADRSNSPLNRINVRRMLNDIKKKMYRSLDAIRFELNNTTTQSRARKIVNDILYVYRNIEALQSYSVTVNSPGGAEADVMNIVIDMVPYGLVERIRIYLNVSEAGAVVSE